MRFRDRIKGRRQSSNVIDARTPQGSAKQELETKVRSNPRTLSDEPIAYNNEKNNNDRAKGAMGAVMRADPKQHFRRMSQTKDPKPGSFEKDAQFFKHNIKDN